jgi:DNA-binding NtrC family response regulator
MGKQHEVLIAEDDEGLRYAFATAFERRGFKVDAAPSGPEAVALLNADGGKYCAILLDMILPGVHGSSLIAHIARTNPRAHVIAVTGYPDRVLFADQADRHVVKAIFVKPVEADDLASFVESRCGREA